MALLDPRTVNTKVTAFVSITTSQHNDEWLRRFAEVIRDLPEVVEFYRMAGQVDHVGTGRMSTQRGQRGLLANQRATLGEESGHELGLLGPEAAHQLVAAAMISIMLNPFLFRHLPAIERQLRRLPQWQNA